MSDDYRVNFARQGTGLMPADKGYRARSAGMGKTTATPSAGSQHTQLPNRAIRGDAGYTHPERPEVRTYTRKRRRNRKAKHQN